MVELKGAVYRKQRVEQLRALSAGELVRRLNETARLPKRSVREYMKTASTCHEVGFGVALRTDSAESFVEDLLELGLLVRNGSLYNVLM